MLNDTVALQPFATASVWHEFMGNAGAVFNIAGIGPAIDIPISTTRVGTFGQVGLGVSGQVLHTGFVGFVRGDVRFGENIDGLAVVGDARYTF
jgi:hypothetical protein